MQIIIRNVSEREATNNGRFTNRLRNYDADRVVCTTRSVIDAPVTIHKGNVHLECRWGAFMLGKTKDSYRGALTPSSVQETITQVVNFLINRKEFPDLNELSNISWHQQGNIAALEFKI